MTTTIPSERETSPFQETLPNIESQKYVAPKNGACV